MRGVMMSGLAAAALGLGGCASLLEPADPVAPLTLALTAPVPEIEARAGRGDNDAEYALSFLMRHGLRGVSREPGRFERLRTGAQTPTTLMITQYIPAVGGGAGRTNIIPVTQPGLNPFVMAVLDRCGAALLTGLTPLAEDLCPEGTAVRLIPAARQAVADRAARTPLP